MSTLFYRSDSNASKVVPFSKLDWTLSRHRADSASAAKVFFTITFERNAFSEIHESNLRKHDVIAEETLTFSQNTAVEHIVK